MSSFNLFGLRGLLSTAGSAVKKWDTSATAGVGRRADRRGAARDACRLQMHTPESASAHRCTRYDHPPRPLRHHGRSTRPATPKPADPRRGTASRHSRRAMWPGRRPNAREGERWRRVPRLVSAACQASPELSGAPTCASEFGPPRVIPRSTPPSEPKVEVEPHLSRGKWIGAGPRFAHSDQFWPAFGGSHDQPSSTRCWPTCAGLALTRP